MHFQHMLNKNCAKKIFIKSASPLTKSQKKFNSLIKRLIKKRALLEKWNKNIQLFKQLYFIALLPLQEKETDRHAQLAHRLSTAFTTKEITSNERQKLSIMIVNLAQHILKTRDDDAIKALYSAHSQSDFYLDATAREQARSGLEYFFESSPDQNQKFEEPREEIRKKRLPSSIRDAYKKLVSSLHPDKEHNNFKRNRKTEIMKLVNEAYEKGKVLELLEFQIKFKQTNQSHLASLNTEHLQQYIEALEKQLIHLNSQIKKATDDFTTEFSFSAFEKIKPNNLLPMLKRDILECKTVVKIIQKEIKIASDIKKLKIWLKSIELPTTNKT